MSKIVHLNSNGVAAILTYLDELYRSGDIEGLVVGVKLKSGEFFCGATDEIGFLEKLGLSQAIINDIQCVANE